MHHRKPEWLKIKIQNMGCQPVVEEMLDRLSLHTVCEEARCPNRMECFGKGTATFMILGKSCTRRCTFCSVEKSCPQPVDDDEPSRIAKAVAELKLMHVVVTSVTRDDLPDGGAGQFARVVEEIRKAGGDVSIEVLVPDFRGDERALEKVVSAQPDIIGHNIETVARLYPEIRPGAVYERSLNLLENVKKMDPCICTKSGIMLGLGEEEDEVIGAMRDLKAAGCDFITLGQYLAPSSKHHPVVEYIEPATFEKYRLLGIEMGFRHVASGPFVRSSYRAEEAIKALKM